VDIGEVVDCLGKGQVHECASGLEVEFDLSIDVGSRVGANEIVANLEKGDRGVNVEDLTTAQIIEGLEERSESCVAEIFSLSIGLNPDTDGSKDVDGVLSCANGFLGIRKGDLGVEVEFPRISTAIGSCGFVEDPSESDG